MTERKQLSNVNVLNRYTNLPVLLDLIERNSIVLLSPDTWSDRCDRELMLEYKRRNKLTCLLASCYSLGNETIHHWSSFAQGASGCRITFDRALLVNTIARQENIRHKKVTYRKINELRERDISNGNMPFIKRWPYRIEEEYRIIYESRNPEDQDRMELAIPIKLDFIRSVTVSQSMPKSVFDRIKTQLGDRLGKRISRSTVFENSAWLGKIKRNCS